MSGKFRVYNENDFAFPCIIYEGKALNQYGVCELLNTIYDDYLHSLEVNKTLRSVIRGLEKYKKYYNLPDILQYYYDSCNDDDKKIILDLAKKLEINLIQKENGYFGFWNEKIKSSKLNGVLR